ncbi:MAG: pentapeptide repeat-containing protein [Proteobacteria bacterium]|nr:pentapeptide repeat-containing protein [Pseudomonadota bacterium]
MDIIPDINEVKSRWDQKDPEFDGTCRERMVLLLKNDCCQGNRQRPLKLDLRGISLNNEDLSGLDLSGYDFSHASMNRINLAKANLSYAVLAGASLEKAILDECEFIGADLTHAGLNECSAKMAGFGGANLSHASMINADLTDSVLSRSILVSADLRASNLTNARLSEADLSGAVFTRANLEKSDLKQSNVANTNFELANMQGCRLLGIRNFTKAGWIGADIRNLDLRGAYLVRRYIADENYLYEFQTQSRWHKIIYWIWWFTSDCGRSIFRWFVWLLTATLIFAGIYTLVDIDYGAHATWFSPIYFSFVTLTTLGYGDAVPASLAAQIFVSLQAITGYMGLGGLLSILGNKMARRAE